MGRQHSESSRATEGDPGLSLTEGMIQIGLLDLQARLKPFGKSLANYRPLPIPKPALALQPIEPALIRAERLYDRAALQAKVAEDMAKLNAHP